MIKVLDRHRGLITIPVPSWVRWMATDESGSLWFYKNKPTPAIKHKAWVENNGIAKFAAYIRPPQDWTQELYTWR